MKKLLIINDLHFRPIIPRNMLAKRVKEIGKRISQDYENHHPVFLCILKGSFIFAADLVRACSIPCEIAFVRLQSYNGTRSAGEVNLLMPADTLLEGRHVIIVEDIIDTGSTLTTFLKYMQSLSPASVEVAVLLRKAESRKFDLNIRYVGFDISDEFVIGYGLDYNESGRNLEGIYQCVKK